MSKMRCVLWSPLAVGCLIVELEVLAPALGDSKCFCAVSGLFPEVEISVEHFCEGSDFLPTTECPAGDGDSRKSKLLAFERLALAWGPALDPSSEQPLPSTSPERLRDTVGGWALTPASCRLRPSHWEIFSLMLTRRSWVEGLPGGRPCQAAVAPFCRRSTSPPPRLPCSSLRASMLRGGSPSVLHW